MELQPIDPLEEMAERYRRYVKGGVYSLEMAGRRDLERDLLLLVERLRKVELRLKDVECRKPSR